MKRLFGILKTVFLLCGAVIGAGFLGGAELAEFFGAAGYAPFLALSGALFFIGFFVVFAREKRKSELPVSEKEESLTVKAFFAAELIFSSAMLAGVNEIFLEAGAGVLSYVLTFALFTISCFCVKKGKRGAEILSASVMPIALVAVNIFLVIFLAKTREVNVFRNGGVVARKVREFFGAASATGGAGIIGITSITGGVTAVTAKAEQSFSVWRGILKAVLFSSLNVFITAPAVTETVKNKSVSGLTVAAAIFSVIVSAEAFLILRTIERAGTAGAGEPIVRALAGQGKVVRTVIFTSLFLATFTSFFTCFAAVSEGAERALPKLGKKTKSSSFKTVLFIFVYLFSLAGLNKIIKFVYPIFGALGVCYIVNSAIKLVKAGGKKRDFLKTDKIARYKNTAKSR